MFHNYAKPSIVFTSCQGEECPPSVAKDTFTHVPSSSSWTSQGQAKKLPSHSHSSTHHYHPHHSTHHINPHSSTHHNHPHHFTHHDHPHSSTHHYHPHHSTHHHRKSPTKRGNLVFVPSKAPSPNTPPVPTDVTKRGNMVFVPSKVQSPKASLTQTKQCNRVYVPSKVTSSKTPPAPTDITKQGNLVFVPPKVQSSKASPVPTDSQSDGARAGSETRSSSSAAVLVSSAIAQFSTTGREGGSCDVKRCVGLERLEARGGLEWGTYESEW